MFKWLLIVFFLFSTVVFGKDQADIVPIVSVQHSQTTISRNGLSAIFKMRLQKWNDGSIIKVFVLPDNTPSHISFCKKTLNVFPHQLRRSWNKLVFTGSGQVPTRLNNKELMIKTIANTPGAIGYLSKDEINDQVKVLEIQ